MPRVLRDEQFHADEVGVVFVTQWCVRRAWLAGQDPLTGKNFSLRKEWIRRRLEALASAFAVDVLSCDSLKSHAPDSSQSTRVSPREHDRQNRCWAKRSMLKYSCPAIFLPNF